MKLGTRIILAAGILSAFSLNIFAQTNDALPVPIDVSAQMNTVTVTNFVTVTVTVTNFVTVTNVPVKAVAKSGDGKAADAKVADAKAAESKPNVPAKYPWVNTLTAGLTLTRGNGDSLLATAKIVSDKKTPVNEFSLGGDATYGSASGVANIETYHGFSQWNHLFSERWYSYLRGEGLHDGIADVKYRGTITSGMGYYLIKQTNTTLTAELGPGGVFERVGSGTNTEDNSYVTMRLAEKFEHKFNKNSARVWENVEILPQLDKISDYLVNSEVGVESALYKSVSLQVFLDDNFNSQPAAGRRRNDVKLVSGVTYKF
jgi:putative salt-induced outer membrane protein YdiY